MWDENVKVAAVAVDNMDIFIKQLNELIKTDKVDRAVFSSVTASISDRIFGRGEDSKGNQIGQYSTGYLKRRVKNNWGGSRKVILQFSGQMKNDFGLIKGDFGFGAGFKNKKNGDKSRWVEETYDKDIFTASKQEENLIEKLHGAELKRVLSGN